MRIPNTVMTLARQQDLDRMFNLDEKGLVRSARRLKLLELPGG